mgnify:CR=1 FL=1
MFNNLLDVVTKEDIHSTTPRTLHYIKWRMDKRNTSNPPNPPKASQPSRTLKDSQPSNPPRASQPSKTCEIS